MRLIILILFLIINLFAYDLKKVDFATFCNYVSYTLNKNIIISQGVNTSFSVFMPYDKMSPSVLLKNFFLILKSKNLSYRLSGNTILVFKTFKIKPNLYTFLIPFVFVPKSVVSKSIKTFFPNLKFVIFNNRLIIFTTPHKYYIIKKYLNSLMSSYLEAKVNFLIVVIDNKRASQLTSDLSLKNPFRHLLLSLVSSSVSVLSSLPNPYQFTLLLKILNSKNLAQTISKPSLDLIEGSNYTLESVHNIPYVKKIVTVNQNGNPITQSQVDYKNIGLKIYIKNVYITSTNIDFDMDIYVQNVISFSNNVPVIDTKHLNTHIQLTKKHHTYLLAGLRSVTKISSNSNVPLLSKLPFFGMFFKDHKSNVEDLSFAFYISTNFFKSIKNGK